MYCVYFSLEITYSIQFGALSRFRTDHLLITKQMLYQMSYEGDITTYVLLEQDIGFEPMTFTLAT